MPAKSMHDQDPRIYHGGLQPRRRAPGGDCDTSLISRCRTKRTPTSPRCAACVRWLDVCDGNMEEGSMRCDANISIRLKGDTSLGTKVEVKNMNSIRNVKRAIENEIKRQIELTEQRRTDCAGNPQF